MENNYEIRGDAVAIFATNKTLGEVEILISLSDLPRLIEFDGKWSITGRKEHIYARSRPRKSVGIKGEIYMHRWLTNCPKGLFVDHKNGNTLDNTRENIRIVTASENSQNRKGATVASKTGIRGVIWDVANKKWSANIQVNKKSIHVGYFNNIDDAVVAVKEKRSKFMTNSYN